MDTIENPKIDRLNRLGEVSLTVRTGRGEKGEEETGDSLLRDRPPSAIRGDPISFSPCPVRQVQAPAACSERLRGACRVS